MGDSLGPLISLSPDDATRPELDPGQPPPARPFRRRRFRHLGFLFLLVVALALAGLWLRFHFDAFKERPLALPATLEPDQPFLFEIPFGMSLRTLAQELTALGVLDQPYYFLALAYLRGDAGRVKAGEYEISPGTTPVALLDLGWVRAHVESWPGVSSVEVALELPATLRVVASRAVVEASRPVGRGWHAVAADGSLHVTVTVAANGANFLLLGPAE